MSAKAYVKLGTMAAGKSLELLKTADTYERTGRTVVVFKPTTDTRSDSHLVESRIGLAHEAIPIDPDKGGGSVLAYAIMRRPDVILIDEAQFLSRYCIEAIIRSVVDKKDIPVIFYGLKTNFKGELFAGSAALLALCDDVAEIKGICKICDRKAIMNQRLINGKPTREGDEVQIGDEEYISVCRKHYYETEEF
ncbi:thymidine kinase [Bacillus thuringiensis]|uniref:thymidine kinase n=1 Tax=Bacillus thuringiensis TaxID=1428 RepID=UPI000BEE7FA9|nr:thymidine kinase [Bacillus thuringiensis]PEE69371.1 thymidine kinase [Bacillus thuringiensis]PET15050.1 thymidine kinase [Bacillus thuringiensis]